jgi:hypothetical protein
MVVSAGTIIPPADLPHNPTQLVVDYQGGESIGAQSSAWIIRTTR